MKETTRINIEKIDDSTYRIRKTGKMRVDGIVYMNHKIMKDVTKDESLKQVANVAALPGIIDHSLAMPDIHWGYGFPIGGVAAFDMDEGVVSPGGVGYDINCGVRLMRSDIDRKELAPHIEKLADTLFNNIPSGVGSKRKDLSLSSKEIGAVLKKGAAWAIENGFGRHEDLDFIEEGGLIDGADPDTVSDRAKERGRNQLGTLGSGNHFVELGYVDEIYDEHAANLLGLFKNGITVFVHTGSRGLGYQVCDDSIRVMIQAAKKYGIYLPDRQLCCAPIRSPEGKRYMSAMASAANFAFANRQLISHWVRESFESVLGRSSSDMGINLIYDVCHNIAKIEEHEINGKRKDVCVHRKGATRAFPPESVLVPKKYRTIGQPVLIPGDMGRYSYVLLGTKKAFSSTFGSTCHGAGRLMSRKKATKSARGRSIIDELRQKGITVRGASRATLTEEIPDAYKDVADVVEVVSNAGISKKVLRIRPLAVIKG